MNLSKAIKSLRIKPDGSGYTVVAGAADVNSDPIDTAGYEGARVTVGFGAITTGAATSVKAHQGAAADLSDRADLEGSSVTVADDKDNKQVVIDIYRPRKRYVGVTIKRATQNAVIDFMTVELYGTRKLPVTDDDASMVAAAKQLVSPAEGTA